MADLGLDLFRACKRNRRHQGDIDRTFTNTSGAALLYPDYTGFRRRDGSRRAPDVTTFTGDDGAEFIRGVNDINPGTGRAYVGQDEGVSLNNQPGKFGYELWFYFLLPEGTAVPDSLDVRQTGNDAHHYSIRCLNRMSRAAYEGALDNLARAAIARGVALGRQSLTFS